jgi:hypothetical protein
MAIKSEDRASGDKRDAVIGYVRARGDNTRGEMGNERQRGQNTTSEAWKTLGLYIINYSPLFSNSIINMISFKAESVSVSSLAN